MNEEIIDEKKSHKKQVYLIFLCWLVYTIAYIGRYGYSANINLIMAEYATSKADAGMVTSFFFFAYGVGQIVNAFCCKYYNKKLAITLSLSVSALLNLTLFINIPFEIIKYLWLVNGLAQSVLWPTLILTLSEHLDDKHLKPSVIVMSSTVSIGTFLVYGLSAGFVALNNYKLIFIVAAVVMLVAGSLWFFTYRFSKKEIVEKKEIENQIDTSNLDETKQVEIENEQKPVKQKSKLKTSVVLIIVILAVFAIVDNLIKDGLQTWVPAILKDTFNLPDTLSIILTLLLPLLGLLGAALAVFGKKIINNFITLSMVFYVVAMICLALINATLKLDSWIFLMGLFGLATLIMQTINNIITSMAPLYLREEVNSGFLAGMLNAFCYVGSTVSSYGLGLIFDKSGNWSMPFNLLFVCSLVCVVIGLTYTIVHFINEKKKSQKENSKEEVSEN